MRSLTRTPGFTVLGVTVLAPGIGATSAIFSLVSAVWLKPLPFADAERLVTLWLHISVNGGQPRRSLSRQLRMGSGTAAFGIGSV